MKTLAAILGLWLLLPAVVPAQPPANVPAGSVAAAEEFVDAAAQLSDNPLSPGDRIEIIYYDEPGFGDKGQQLETTIEQDGTIFVPLLGNFEAAGKTPRQLEDALKESLSQYVDNPVLHVTVIYYRKMAAFLVGACVHQGAYPVTAGQTVSRFIAENDGLLGDADPSRISVVRRNGELIRLDLEQFFQNGDVSQDIALQPGDRVFVPRKQETFIEKTLRVAQLASLVLQVAILAVVLTR